MDLRYFCATLRSRFRKELEKTLKKGEAVLEDTVSFCSDLIKSKSVTPNDDGALERIKDYLIKAGFDEAKILTFRLRTVRTL